jgi:folate-dependent phosphoribosylglycinamide formyltransferase PurN
MKVGLLLSGSDQPAWFYRAVKNMIDETDAKIKVVCIETQTSPNTSETANRISDLLPNQFKHRLPLFVKKLWAWVAQDKVDYSMVMTEELKQKVETKNIVSIEGLQDVHTVRYTPIQEDNNRRYIPEKTIDLIRENCELVINFSGGILSGDILDAPKHGVIGFHHGDIRKYRGVRSRFWEFMNNESKTGVTLQGYTNELDSGYIIDYQEADISDAKSWSDVLYKKYNMSEEILSNGIRNILDPEFEPSKPEQLGELYLKSDHRGYGVKMKYLTCVLKRVML